MHWSSWSQFFSMGGYGLYVWGSYGLTFILLGGEVLMLITKKATTPEVGPLARFINVLGATIVGAAATTSVMLFAARGLGFSGGGFAYLLIFITATGASYRVVCKLTALHPFVKILVAFLGVILIAVFAANWRILGAESPAVPLVIVVVLLATGYWVSGLKKDKRANGK